ncbi:hypothetical protein NECAME_07542 [Necator americanus]|uniref:Tudor-knot domain-containing protein n=1 Tax=Necator americanus TaxID=51031 RepID=W2TQ72_NECAM|nr:hypothetical protein NECAME_07542 [Necator americanus]ETN83182.1 hypothetical protein NECAME_07542 [Necator americanus]
MKREKLPSIWNSASWNDGVTRLFIVRITFWTFMLNGEEIAVGNSYLVRGRRGRWRSATVLDKREQKNGGIECYVHFDGDDRRLDQWVELAKVKPRSQRFKHMLPICESREKRVRKTKESSPNSLVIDYSDVLEEEHKEVTKVKYIEVVRFGEFEIDTW